MVNKQTADYHPSLSELTAKIHPIIFLWTPEGFISAEYFWIFFSDLYNIQWLRKSSCVKITVNYVNTFVSQKS